MKPTGNGLRAYRRGYQSGSNNETRNNPYTFVSQKKSATASWWETGYDRGEKDRLEIKISQEKVAH